jgi:hypothetical protein
MVNGLIAGTKMQPGESKGKRGMNEMWEVLDELIREKVFLKRKCGCHKFMS